MTTLVHGIDLVCVARIAQLVDRHGDRFLNRVFTARERARGEGSRRWPEHLAARFAAKEAVFKALGTGFDGLSWTDAEVVSLPTGEPTLALHGRAAAAAASRGVTIWLITLSHTSHHAIASVIGLGS